MKAPDVQQVLQGPVIARYDPARKPPLQTGPRSGFAGPQAQRAPGGQGSARSERPWGLRLFPFLQHTHGITLLVNALPFAFVHFFHDLFFGVT